MARNPIRAFTMLGAILIMSVAPLFAAARGEASCHMPACEGEPQGTITALSCCCEAHNAPAETSLPGAGARTQTLADSGSALVAGAPYLQGSLTAPLQGHPGVPEPVPLYLLHSVLLR
jgi:hypothetical protein